MRRFGAAVGAALVLTLFGSTAAWACGGLVAANGAVNLVRTSTLAAYRNGVEHYVTSFEFQGAAKNFGSIVPLPGIPSRVRKGGDWTLQRLQQEVQPPVARGEFAAVADAAGTAVVLEEKKIDALDVAILKGGGDEVGRWAEENGFSLPPDAPEVLDFYAARSPIFMAVRFDVDRARRQDFGEGDGTPVHLTIPTPNPWVPLRILALGKEPEERIQADVFLLTERSPVLLPAPADKGAPSGMILDRREPASKDLLRDLRSDRGMRWLPREGMWLTYLRIDTPAEKLTHDLAVDPTGAGIPSPVAAGLVSLPGSLDLPLHEPPGFWTWAAAAVAAFAMLLLMDRLVLARR